MSSEMFVEPFAVPKPEVRDQIDALGLDSKRPIVVADADEVLFRFVDGLERFLNRRKLVLDITRYELAGSIRHGKTGRPLPKEKLASTLDAFFKSETKKLAPVDGAAEHLAQIAEFAQIVVLSNLPFHKKADREHALANHDMPYPLIANTGSKGPAIAYMGNKTDAPIVFIDDSPVHLDSAKKHWKNAYCLHYVDDHRLKPLVIDLDLAHPSAVDWPTLTRYIRAYLRDWIPE